MKITKLLKGAPITHITRSVEPTPWELKDGFPESLPEWAKDYYRNTTNPTK